MDRTMAGDGAFVESVGLRAADGVELVGELAYPADGPTRGVAWIANPHPFMGGRMDNNVVRALAGGLPARAGFATLRFDYRGVGRSGGQLTREQLADNMSRFLATGYAPDDADKRLDARAADAFCRRELADLPRVAVGYSFGAYLVSELLGERDSAPPAAAVVICPTLRTHDLSALARWPGERLMICSDDDFATPAVVGRAFAATAPGLAVRWFTGADHFFKAREADLVEAVAEFLARVPAGRDD